MAQCTVYGPAYSTYTRSVLLTLEEKGVPYTLEHVDLFDGSNKGAAHLARQPFGKVPAFEHGDIALYEAVPIMFYIDGAFGGPSLQPADVVERARMLQVISIINGYAYSAWITNILFPRVVTPMLGGACDEEQIKSALPLAQCSVKALNDIVDGHKFCAGDTLSLADLHLAPVYDYLSRTPDGEALLQDAPNLTRWWAHMRERPSVVKTSPKLG